MKQTPELIKAQKQMQPGVITPNGFFGTDKRNLIDILIEDNAAVQRLGTSHKEIAERMKYFRNIGIDNYGDWTKTDDHFDVLVESVRGKFPCPFGHSGMIDKTNITVKNLNTGKELFYTDLQIHFIDHHEFYQGKGSQYRLEPEMIVEILEIL